MRGALTLCAEPGCCAPVQRGRCAAHVRPSRWGQGNRGGQRSSAMRERVLREEPVCHYCGSAPSVEVDHDRPLAEGGSSERANLHGACSACHRDKTARESRRAREMAR